MGFSSRLIKSIGDRYNLLPYKRIVFFKWTNFTHHMTYHASTLPPFASFCLSNNPSNRQQRNIKADQQVYILAYTSTTKEYRQKLQKTNLMMVQLATSSDHDDRRLFDWVLKSGMVCSSGNVDQR
ncbi:hypothetical protein L1887_19881 [Cichorium endivia]|nr:hypothetical protein L1887_19881 [Cichorium endivia]